MNKQDLIDSVHKYVKVMNTKFYNNIEKKLENYPNKIFQIVEDPYLLEAIRINVCYSPSDWIIYVTDVQPSEEIIYREKILNKRQYTNMLNQMQSIKNDTIYDICETSFENEISNPTKYFFVLSHDNNLSYKIKCENIYGVVNIILGIEVFNFLNYQRNDRLCDMIKTEHFNNTSVKKNIDMIDEYYKKIKNLRFTLSDKIMIYSGITRMLLGTIYTEDIDLIVLFNMHKQDKLDIIFNYFKGKQYDLTVLIDDTNWYKRDEQKYKVRANKGEKYFTFDYQKNLLTYQQPMQLGAEDIYEVCSNPRYHFHFMGMKCLCIDGFINKLISRARPSSFVDLLALEKYNNISIKGMCIPYISIAQGNYKIYDNKGKKILLEQTKKYYKEWYGETLSLQELDKKIPLCSDTTYDIYSGSNIKDKEMGPLKYFHNRCKLYFLEKYAKNADVLIDVGSGKLLDLRFWSEINIKKVYAIEPSKESIEKGQNILKEFTGNPEVKIINSIGDIDWNKLDIDEKADCISFMFTLHYMISNFSTVIENIKNFSKPNGKVIIFILDGDKLNDYFINNKKDLVVHGKQEPLFVVHPFYDINKNLTNDEDILVYMKGTYGVSKGSLEKIINVGKLINIFSDNGFTLLEKTNLDKINIKERFRTDKNLLQISQNYMALVFNNDNK